MKSILLASASIVAFAGAAAAEVTFGGDASLGYNIDNGDEPSGLGEGFFWEANLGVTFSQELNNGLTAGATLSVNLVDDDNDGTDSSSLSVDDDFLLFLTAESGGLYFGDTTFAAEDNWEAAGDMNADRFSEQDDETVLKGVFSYSGIDGAVSYVVADAEDDRPTDDLDQLSIGAKTSVGAFNLSVAYQEESESLTSAIGSAYDPEVSNEDFSTSEVFAISAGTTFSGADVRVGYAADLTLEDNSLGVEASYPFGPVTLGAYYVFETDDPSDYDVGTEYENSFGVTADYASGPLTVSAFYEFDDDGDDADTGDVTDADEDDDYGVEVGYDVGNGLALYAGFLDEDGNYVGAEYDLGGDATMIVSYSDLDEIGAREYEAGTTIAVNFAF